jgi:hypothetical protein
VIVSLGCADEPLRPLFGVRLTAVRKWKGEKKKIAKVVVKPMITTKARRRPSFLAFSILTFMLPKQRLFVGEQEVVDFNCVRDAAKINLPKFAPDRLRA